MPLCPETVLVSSLVVLFHGQWLRACIDEGPGRAIHLVVVAIPAQLVVFKSSDACDCSRMKSAAILVCWIAISPNKLKACSSTWRMSCFVVKSRLVLDDDHGPHVGEAKTNMGRLR